MMDEDQVGIPLEPRVPVQAYVACGVLLAALGIAAAVVWIAVF